MKAVQEVGSESKEPAENSSPRSEADNAASPTSLVQGPSNVWSLTYVVLFQAQWRGAYLHLERSQTICR